MFCQYSGRSCCHGTIQLGLPSEAGLVVAGDEVNYSGVIRKLDDAVALMLSYTFIGEQTVQKWAEAVIRVEEFSVLQSGEQMELLRPRSLSFNTSLDGTVVLKAEL